MNPCCKSKSISQALGNGGFFCALQKIISANKVFIVNCILMKSITYNEKLDIILSILFEANRTKDSDIVPVQSTTNNNGDVKKTKVPELAYALTFEGKVLVESGGFEHKNKLERSNILLNRWIAIVVAIGTFGLLILEICRFFIELCKNNCGFQ